MLLLTCLRFRTLTTQACTPDDRKISIPFRIRNWQAEKARSPKKLFAEQLLWNAMPLSALRPDLADRLDWLMCRVTILQSPSAVDNTHPLS